MSNIGDFCFRLRRNGLTGRYLFCSISEISNFGDAMFFNYRVVLTLMFATQLMACSLLPPHHLEDPNENLSTIVRVRDVTKSLRCEISTFLLENRLRLGILHSLKQDPNDLIGVSPYAVIRKKYPTMNIDENQYSAIQIDLKNVDSATLSIGYDFKKPTTFQKPDMATYGQILKSANYEDFRAGPSLSGGATFELVQSLALQQNADLGPSISDPTANGKKSGPLKRIKPEGQALPNAAMFTTAFDGQPPADESFYCYKSLAKSFPDLYIPKRNVTDILIGASEDIMSVMNHAHETEEKFQRIFIGSTNETLARWLLKQAEELYSNDSSLFGSSDRIYYGQLKYSFGLEIHPTLDLKYTIVASFVNPLIPDLTGGVDHTSTFTIWLNSEYAVPVLTSAQGNSCIQVDKGRCAKASGPFGFRVAAP